MTERTYWLPLALILSLVTALAACDPSPGGEHDDDDGETNDDDNSDDDDNTSDDDDDNDTTADFSVGALGWTGRLEVAADASGESGVATVTYFFNYWTETDPLPVLNCRQRIQAQADLSFGLGSVPGDTCSNCTGYLVLDPDTVVDISDPDEEPEDCDPAVLDAEYSNYGMALLYSAAQGGAYGDFATMAFMDDSIHSELGTDWALFGGQTADDLEEAAATGMPPRDYEASGAIQALPGTLATKVGLSDYANSAGNGSNWYGFWSLGRNPDLNPFESTSANGYILDGEYSLEAIWTITFAR